MGVVGFNSASVVGTRAAPVTVLILRHGPSLATIGYSSSPHAPVGPTYRYLRYHRPPGHSHHQTLHPLMPGGSTRYSRVRQGHDVRTFCSKLPVQSEVMRLVAHNEPNRKTGDAHNDTKRDNGLEHLSDGASPSSEPTGATPFASGPRLVSEGSDQFYAYSAERGEAEERTSGGGKVPSRVGVASTSTPLIGGIDADGFGGAKLSGDHGAGTLSGKRGTSSGNGGSASQMRYEDAGREFQWSSAGEGDTPPSVPPPTRQQLMAHFLGCAVPMFGFGFMDNMIMLHSGKYIDLNAGVAFGMSTLSAAACGQIFSDVSGVFCGGLVESFAGWLGLPQSSFLPGQRGLSQVRTIGTVGRCLGVIIGCLAGMISIPWMNLDQVEIKKREAQLNPIFLTIAHQAERMLGCSCNIFLADNETGELYDVTVSPPPPGIPVCNRDGTVNDHVVAHVARTERPLNLRDITVSEKGIRAVKVDKLGKRNCVVCNDDNVPEGPVGEGGAARREVKREDSERLDDGCRIDPESHSLQQVVIPDSVAHSLLCYPIFDDTSSRLIGVVLLGDKKLPKVGSDFLPFRRDDEKMLKMTCEHLSLYIALVAANVHEDSINDEQQSSWVCPENHPTPLTQKVSPYHVPAATHEANGTRSHAHYGSSQNSYFSKFLNSFPTLPSFNPRHANHDASQGHNHNQATMLPMTPLAIGKMLQLSSPPPQGGPHSKSSLPSASSTLHTSTPSSSTLHTSTPSSTSTCNSRGLGKTDTGTDSAPTDTDTTTDRGTVDSAEGKSYFRRNSLFAPIWRRASVVIESP